MREDRAVRVLREDLPGELADGGAGAAPVTVVCALPCAGTVSFVSARVTVPAGTSLVERLSSSGAPESFVYVRVFVTGLLSSYGQE